jgi:Fic family protein
MDIYRYVLYLEMMWMAGNDTVMDIPLDSIMSKLRIKNNKQSEYYVYPASKVYFDDGKIRKMHWDIYVCKTDCDEKTLRHSFCYAVTKEYANALSKLIEASSKLYETTCISGNEVKKLELIRLLYLDFLNKFTKDDLERYEQAMYTKYVYGTTSIEGNTYTLLQTNITLNEGLTVSGKEKREFYEIENYGKLQEYVKSKNHFDINMGLIKKIHSIIMYNIDDDAAGCFRHIEVGITGTEFVPTSYLEIEEELDNLIMWYNKNEHNLHPVELAAGFHQKFEQIHPFKDGNGRVGRELIRIILRNNQYPTIFIDNSNREEYLSCLEEGGRGGDYHMLCKFLVGNLIDVHKTLLDNAKTVLNKPLNDLFKFCETCGKREKCNELMEQIQEILG